jgi:hypothetical protein
MGDRCATSATSLLAANRSWGEMPEIRVLVHAVGIRRKFLWIQLLPPHPPQTREAISVGFSDAAFVVPGVVSSVSLNTETYVTTVDLRERCGQAAISNPHFTFHAPAWMHLRANGEQPLLEQLVCLDRVVPQQGRVPWLRFLSGVVSELPEYNGTRAKDVSELIVVPDASDVSIGVRLDFVDHPRRVSEQPGELGNQIIEWYEWKLHLAIDAHAAHPTSTFTWLQEN